MKIKVAKKKDKKIILEFLVRLNKHERKFYKNFTSLLKFRKACKEELAQILDNKKFHFLIATEVKKPIGFIYGKIIDTPRYKNNKTGVVAEMYVEPKDRKKGIGKALLKELFRWFRKNKISNVQVFTETQNKTAIKFFKKERFKETVKRMEKRV